MSFHKFHKCSGTTVKGTSCTKPVKNIGDVCYLHKNSKLPVTNTHVVVNNPSMGVSIGECGICLSNVIEGEDSGLLCNHIFHSECLKCVIKAECPVCRGPLAFKSSNSNKVNVAVINLREKEEKEKTRKETIAEDMKIAKEIHDREVEESSRYHNSHCDPIIEKALEDSLFTQEVDDYNMIYGILEDSYNLFKAEEESLMFKEIEDAETANELVNYFRELFIIYNTDRIVIKLR